MGTPILQVENLSFQYDKRTAHTLSNVSFTAQQGEWLGIVGNNGSGKSTLAKLLVGLLQPEEGQIHINGMKVNQENIWKVRSKIGLVFQNPDNQFIGTTVEDDVAFGLENLNMPYEDMKARVDEALSLVGMTDFRYYDPSNLSGGQKQRVAIAGILALKPSILILDEAFVMLDPKSRRELLATLKKLKQDENITIISITHDMNEAVDADRIIVLKAGKIVNSGTPSEVFHEEQELEPPFAEQLRRLLQERNAKVPPEFMTEQELVRWLCK
ncbi:MULTISPECIES: energy-coupling factor transporter ATPase [Bacillaceae]|uniref:Energy-coupling factor transporter ATPase n=1 Tax=Evansella alkalicola TaxID=745819 RepID=A0ABS6JSV8_9BACI|nr:MULTISPECIES: energy-coupling factor transporter ATPase [Bacillaceae]MBU9721661.1 energy-coupling factor transporter ATPase [Bacillus alkalicola]